MLWAHYASMSTDPQRAAPWLYADAADDDDEKRTWGTALFRVRAHTARALGEFSLHPSLDEHVLLVNTVLTVKSLSSWHADAALPSSALAASDVMRQGTEALSPALLCRNGFSIGETVHALADSAAARQPRDVLKGHNLVIDLDESA